MKTRETKRESHKMRVEFNRREFMWIDTLDTVDIRFHHYFETEFEQLNQCRVKSKAKNIDSLRHRDYHWDSTCSRSEHFVCWQPLDIDRLNACRVKWRLDRNSQRRRLRCSSGLICMFYRRFPWRNPMRHDFRRGKSHRWRDILDNSCPTARTVHYGRDTRMDTKQKDISGWSSVGVRLPSSLLSVEREGRWSVLLVLVSAHNRDCRDWRQWHDVSDSARERPEWMEKRDNRSLTRALEEKKDRFERGRSSAPRTSSLSGLSSSYEIYIKIFARHGHEGDDLLEVWVIYWNMLWNRRNTLCPACRDILVEFHPPPADHWSTRTRRRIDFSAEHSVALHSSPSVCGIDRFSGEWNPGFCWSSIWKANEE